ncbi:MAG: Scr1 family TA system antitoxin-like transcriptional regulator [Pseudonocardiaceae bacterium]
MQRQEMLYRPDKRFHFILTEAALRYCLVSADIMIGQLDRLMAISSMRNVKLGIIDFKTKYVIDPRHNFWVLDNDLVQVETYSAELTFVSLKRSSCTAASSSNMPQSPATEARPGRSSPA